MSNITQAKGIVLPLESLLQSVGGASYIKTKNGDNLQEWMDSIIRVLEDAGISVDQESGTDISGLNVNDWVNYFEPIVEDNLDLGVQIKLIKDTNRVGIRFKNYSSEYSMSSIAYVEVLNSSVIDAGPLGHSEQIINVNGPVSFGDGNPGRWGKNGIYIEPEILVQDHKEYYLDLTRLDEGTVLRLVVLQLVTDSEDAVSFISMGDRVIGANPELPINVLFTPTDTSALDVKWGQINGDGKPEDNATYGSPWDLVTGDNKPSDGATVNHTFVQNTAPVEGVVVGDIWIKTDEGNKLYIYEDGIGWQSRQDDGITTALVLASESQAAVDGKINTYFENEPPNVTTHPLLSEGDLWFDLDDGKHLYVYQSDLWLTAQDEALAQAIDDASEAAAKVDGKVTTYFSHTDPYLYEAVSEGDLWYDQNTETLKRWNVEVTSWDLVANLATKTSQLEDDQGLGSTAFWENITGDNKPADSATKNNIFVQPNAPIDLAVISLNDIWLDTDDGNKFHTWDGDNWIYRRDSDFDYALDNFADVQNQIDGKATTYYQTEAPDINSNPPPSEGDMWFDTDNGNAIHIYESGVWVNRPDSQIAQALNDAATAQATADGKVTSYFTDNEPVPPAEGFAEGDLWYSTVTKLLKRWDSANTEWDTVSNAYSDTNELTDGAELGLTASWTRVDGDGKPADYATVNHIFAQATAPTIGPNGPSDVLVSGDLWYDTDDGNLLHIWDGGSWVARRDAEIDAAFAQISAQQTNLDGKATIYYEATAPDSGSNPPPSEGDIWFDTDDGNKIHVYESSVWVVRQDSAIAQALGDAATAQASADGKVTTYFSNTEPTAPAGGFAEGDLWYSETTKLLKRWDLANTEWDTVSNSYDNTNQLLDGAALGSTADWAQVTGSDKPQDNATVNNVITQAAAPTTGTHNLQPGDIWIDTDDSNKLHIWDGASWVVRRDSGIDDALTQVANQQAAVDGKATIYYQATAPDSGSVPVPSEGDIWFDTDDGNKIHIYESSTWVVRQDSEIATALNNATTAQATADGKVTTYFQDTEPTPPPALSEGDLWYSNLTKLLKRYDAGGTSWIVVSNSFDNTNQLVDGANLGQTADWSQVTGANKPFDNANVNNTFVGTTAPSSGVHNLQDGDLWVNTSEGNVVYAWEVDQWVNRRDGQIVSTRADLDSVVNANLQSLLDNADTHERVVQVENTIITQNSGNETLAQQVSTLQTDVGSLQTTTTQHATSLNGIRAEYGIHLNNNGHIAGISLVSNLVDLSSPPLSEFTIVADQFKLVKPGGTPGVAQVPFEIDAATGNVAIAGDLIVHGSISSDQMGTGSVTTTILADNVITTAKIQNGAVQAAQIIADAINNTHIATDAVNNDSILDGSVQNLSLADDAIDSRTIATGAVIADSISANAVTTSAIAADAITANEIAANAVLASNIAANAINASHIVAGAISATELAADSVTATQIATGAITAGSISAGVINNTHIATNAVGSSELADNAVTSGSIVADAINNTHISINAVNSDSIASDAVNGVHISTDAIDGDHIQAGTITGNLIAASTIAANNIAANAIGANQIAANAVTADKISVSNLEAISATMGTVTGGTFRTASSGYRTEISNSGSYPIWVGTGSKTAANAIFYIDTSGNAKFTGDITIGSGDITTSMLASGCVTSGKIGTSAVTSTSISSNAITSSKIAADAITADKIAANTITAGEIAANAITASELAASSITAGHITSNAITSAKIAADAITADKINVTSLSAVSATMGTVTGGTFRTASSGQRTEISNSGSYPIWFGTGTKNDANGTFYVKTDGSAYFDGELAVGSVTFETIEPGSLTEESEATSSSTGSSITLNPSGTHASAGFPVTLTCKLNYSRHILAYVTIDVTFTIKFYRGSGTLLNTQTFTATRFSLIESEPGNTFESTSWSANTTIEYVDSYATAGARDYYCTVTRSYTPSGTGQNTQSMTFKTYELKN